MLNEANNEVGADAAMSAICDRDEDVYHPYIDNDITGLNYSSDPEGVTRVGLELCIFKAMLPYNSGTRPTPPTDCEGKNDLTIIYRRMTCDCTDEYGDLPPEGCSEHSCGYTYPDVGYPFNESDYIMSKITQRFGPTRPFPLEKPDYINPHPQAIFLILDDSGSANNAVDWTQTYNGIINYYISSGLSLREAERKVNVTKCHGLLENSSVSYNSDPNNYYGFVPANYSMLSALNYAMGKAFPYS